MSTAYHHNVCNSQIIAIIVAKLLLLLYQYPLLKLEHVYAQLE